MKPKHILLCLLAMLASITAKANYPWDFQAGGLYYAITSSNSVCVTYYHYDDEDGSRSSIYSGSKTIPGTVTYNETTYNVTAIGRYAFYDCEYLTSVTIPESVTFIGANAFEYCTSLTSISIPESVTTIGDNAFYACGLTSVTCNRETPPSISSYTFSSYTSTLYVPYGCEAVYRAAAYWSSFGTIIEDAGPSITFADDAVKALCVSNWDTTGDGELGEKEAAAVTDIGTVFKNNGSISSFNELQYFIGLTSLTYDSFYGCSSLASITIPKNVNTINSNPFQFCNVLVNIVVANDNTSFDSRDNCNAIIETASNTLVCGCGNSAVPNTVTSIGRNAFLNTSLSSIIIPEGVTSIGEHAFAYCYRLTEVSIPESVTSIGGGAFYDCRSLRKAYFTNLASLCGITFQWSIMDGEEYSSNPLFYAQDLYVDGELLSGDVVIPEGVETIASSAFYKRENITSVHIPSSVTGIGSYAFYGCSSLSSVNLPNIRNIYSYTFYGCPLTSITIPSSVIRIYDYAFRFCNTLTDVILSDNLIEIGKQAFEGCSNLEAITIPNSVTDISPGAFSGCI